MTSKPIKNFSPKPKLGLLPLPVKHPVETKAKHSIAAFNLREGEVVGVKVTLRGNRMYDFFQKLTSIVLPRIKDFQGVSKKTIDQSGNYTLGLSEQIVFPEVEYDKIGRIQGLEITISTSAKDAKSSLMLLTALGNAFYQRSEIS